MAVFSVNIADEDVGRVISAMCANYGYKAEINNPDWNPSLPRPNIAKIFHAILIYLFLLLCLSRRFSCFESVRLIRCFCHTFWW